MARKKSTDASIKKQEKTPARALEARPLSPLEEMESFYGSLFERPWLRQIRWDLPAWGELARPFEGRVANVDVIDRDKEMLVRAEIPGVKKCEKRRPGDFTERQPPHHLGQHKTRGDN